MSRTPPLLNVENWDTTESLAPKLVDKSKGKIVKYLVRISRAYDRCIGHPVTITKPYGVRICSCGVF